MILENILQSISMEVCGRARKELANPVSVIRLATSVRPDLCPNCLQRLSADDTRRQRIKVPA